MLLTIPVLLLVASFILTIASAAWGKVPLWVAVLLLNIWALMSVLPR